MALGAMAALSAGAQGGMAIADLVKKLKKRKMEGPEPDPMAGAIAQGEARMGRDLSGRVDPRLARATTDAVARPHAEALMESTRGIGPAAGSRMKERSLMRQASEISGARADLLKSADDRASRVAGRLAARGERNMARRDEHRMARYGEESGGERAAGAVGGLLGEGANIGMLLQRLRESGKRTGGKRRRSGYGAKVGGPNPFTV